MPENQAAGPSRPDGTRQNPDRPNTCRLCGARFLVDQRAIDEVRGAYPDTNDHDAANLVEHCRRCGGLTEFDEDQARSLRLRALGRVVDRCK